MTEKRPYWSHKRAAHLSRIDSALAITNGGDATNRRCAAVAGVGDPGNHIMNTYRASRHHRCRLQRMLQILQNASRFFYIGWPQND
jgi:hypothetical protein